MVTMKPPNSWYSVKALATAEDGPAEVYIYDEIPAFGSAAANFARDLAGIDASEITVRINSPGGSVFDGIAIGNAIAGHPAHVTGVVDGVAASIASVIAVKCDTLVMNENSQLMLHNAWDVLMGNADDFQQAADRLRGFSANIAAIYASKAGGTVDEWRSVMDSETWYTADEAVAAGLADKVMAADTAKMTPSYARASFDLSKFKHPGRQAAPAPQIAARAQAPQPVEAEDTTLQIGGGKSVEAGIIQGKEPTVATLKESLVEKLGLDADADDEAIAAKVGELTEAANKEPEPAPEPSTEQITTAAAKLGLALVDKAAYEQTTAAVRELQAVRAAQVKADDERLIDEAVKAGKLAPANKANFLKLMEHDRVGIRATLAQLPAGLIPVAEMGHGVGSEEDHLDSDLASVYAKVTGITLGKDA